MAIQFHNQKILIRSGQVATSAACCCDNEPFYQCGLGPDCPTTVVVQISGMLGTNGEGVNCSEANGIYTMAMYSLAAYSSAVPGGSSPKPEWVATLNCDQGRWMIGLTYDGDQLIETAQWRRDNVNGCPVPGPYSFEGCPWCTCSGGSAALL